MYICDLYSALERVFDYARVALRATLCERIWRFRAGLRRIGRD